MQESNFLGCGDVAKRYRVSKQTIRKMSKDGRMPAPKRMGNKDIWNRKELEEWETQ